MANGRIPGPRIFRAGKGIMRTGGHFWYNGVEVDGADAWRGAVRSQIKAKVDWIKIFITGGVADRDSDPTACDVTREEIVAAIAEAHRAGRKVAGHGYGGEGVTWAIEAGMDSVEHGTFLTEEQLRLMAARGTWLVATAGVMERGAIAPEVPEEFARKFAMVNELYPKTLAMARKLGVKVAVGTDLRHARLDADMAKLTLGGYTPMEAIQAATIRGAELLGIEQETGTVEVGKLADLVAIEGDPLQDIRTTGAVRHVVRGGLFYQVDVPARELSL